MGDLLLRSYYTHKIIMQIVFCLVILTFYHYHSNNSVKKPIFIIDCLMCFLENRWAWWGYCNLRT